jgi:hypothetical protein
MARKLVMRADRTSVRRWRAAFADLWSDRPTRAGIVVAGVSLWLTLTLVEPWFLVLLLSALGAIRVRSTRRVPAAPVDDWE